ncbi:MAG: hypothetical protein NTZ78_00490 [Candidatus Aureabacteria bacterium]|nr:hypothetical protein [Candidatus Auribacterota bacterium]
MQQGMAQETPLNAHGMGMQSSIRMRGNGTQRTDGTGYIPQLRPPSHAC